MRRVALFALTLGCLLAPAAAAHAASEEGIPPPVAGCAPDSDAPPGSAPHRLPPDMWVHMHWIPFDEARLHRQLQTDREERWSWLRHDAQTIAGLAARRGRKDPRRLAAALAAPHAGKVRALPGTRREAVVQTAYHPSRSDDGGRDGRRVAFAATTRAGGRARLYVRDLGERAARAASGPAAGFSDEPSLSPDGLQVAWSEQPRGARRSRLGRCGQRLLVRNMASGRTRGVSRDSAGRPLGGWKGQPQLSGEARRVAFTSDASTPPAGGPGGLEALVRDLAAGTTTVVEPVAPLGSFDTGAGALQPVGVPLCSLAPPAW